MALDLHTTRVTLGEEQELLEVLRQTSTEAFTPLLEYAGGTISVALLVHTMVTTVKDSGVSKERVPDILARLINNRFVASAATRSFREQVAK